MLAARCGRSLKNVAGTDWDFSIGVQKDKFCPYLQASDFLFSNKWVPSGRTYSTIKHLKSNCHCCQWLNELERRWFLPRFLCCIFSAGDEVVVSDGQKQGNAMVNGEGWEILERNKKITGFSGGFKHCFIFAPKIGEMIQFDWYNPEV